MYRPQRFSPTHSASCIFKQQRESVSCQDSTINITVSNIADTRKTLVFKELIQIIVHLSHISPVQATDYNSSFFSLKKNNIDTTQTRTHTRNTIQSLVDSHRTFGKKKKTFFQISNLISSLSTE